MSILSNISTITLVAAASLVSNVSMAQTTSGSAHVSINISSFDLIDLAPNDGITPYFAFGQGYGERFNDITTTSGSYGPNQAFKSGNSRIDSLEYNDNSSVTIDGGAFGFGDALHGITSKAYQTKPGFFSSDVRIDHAFHLSPNTQLVIKGTISGSVELNNVGDYYSDNYAFYGIAAQGQNGIPEQSSYASGHWSVDGNAASSQLFSVMLNNNSTAELRGELHAATSTLNDFYAPTPVPEPETWAMMGVGLLGLGVFARKRRAHQQS